MSDGSVLTGNISAIKSWQILQKTGGGVFLIVGMGHVDLYLGNLLDCIIHRYIFIYTLYTLILRSHVPGDNARVVVHSVFTHSLIHLSSI